MVRASGPCRCLDVAGCRRENESPIMLQRRAHRGPIRHKEGKPIQPRVQDKEQSAKQGTGGGGGSTLGGAGRRAAPPARQGPPRTVSTKTCPRPPRGRAEAADGAMCIPWTRWRVECAPRRALRGALRGARRGAGTPCRREVWQARKSLQGCQCSNYWACSIF